MTSTRPTPRFLAALRGLARRLACAASLVVVALVLAPSAGAQETATLIADQVQVDRQGRLIATGSVEVWQGSTRMTARRVVFDRRSDRLDVEGPITLSDGPDTVILADQAMLNPGLRQGLLIGARMVLDQQLQVAAARVQRGGDGTARMDQVVASSCEVCADRPTPLWEIRAQSVTHLPDEGRMRFERAQLRFAGVAVAYVPRMTLPTPGTTRLRGFLRPTVSVDSTLGLSFGMPYFVPFGPDRDLTLTPHVTTQGSASLGFRWRAARPNGGIQVLGQVSTDRILPDRLRGYVHVRALFHLRDDWRLTSDFLLASDRTYLESYDITSEARFSGHLTLERIRRDQAIRARTLGYYSLRATDDNATLPNAAMQASLDQRHGLAGGEARVLLGAQAFARASTIDGTLGRDVARAYAQAGWRRSAVLPGGVQGTVALQGRVDHVAVADDSAYPDPVTRTNLQGMVEFRWPLAAADASGARHVLEPIVQLIGAQTRGGALPNDDHTMPELDAGNLFALTRYSGMDARDDGTRVNAGLRWTRQDLGGWSTEALIGGIWRDAPLAGLDPAHVQPLGQTRSHWLVAGRLHIAQGPAVTMRLLLDPQAELSRAESNMTWSRNGTTVATRYLYAPASTFEDRTVALSEWSFDISRRLDSGWSTRLGWEYDVAQSLFATARTGIEFRNECLLFDLSLAQRFVTATNTTESTSFEMRLELLGIGGRAPSVNGRTCRS